MPIESLPAAQQEIPYEASLPILPFLALPVVAILLSLLLVWQGQHWLAADDATLSPVLGRLPTLALIVSVTLLASRAAQIYAQFRLGHRPPRLVRQIIAVIGVTVATGVITAVVWDVPVASLMTTSGLLVAMIGLALKNMISDLFNGISLPVKVGDWVEVAGIRGRVVEISWRATKLATLDLTALVIPNTHFIENSFRNFSSDDGFYFETLSITLPSSVSAYQAERILVGAARQVEAVADLPEAPEARITAVTDHGVLWELRFPVPHAGVAPPIRHRIHRALLRDLSYSGVELPIAQLEIRQTAPVARPVRGEAAFLSLIDLFQTLTEAELLLLCDRLRQRHFRAGMPVVRQGDAGESLFIVQEGLLSATILSDGVATEVGKIRPGQFFGELSLLTGAARSATVTPLVDSKAYEIDHDSLAPILLDRPEIAALMSEVLAERQLANAPKLESPAPSKAARDGLAEQILGRIAEFFRLPMWPG